MKRLLKLLFPRTIKSIEDDIFLRATNLVRFQVQSFTNSLIVPAKEVKPEIKIKKKYKCVGIVTINKQFTRYCFDCGDAYTYGVCVPRTWEFYGDNNREGKELFLTEDNYLKENYTIENGVLKKVYK